MTLLTTTELRGHVETDLTEEALQVIIDGNLAEIIEKFGANVEDGDQTDTLRGNGTRYLILNRPAASVTSIVETEDSVNTTLSSDDWRLTETPGMVVERLTTGTNPRLGWPTNDEDSAGLLASWTDFVTVVYTPRDSDPIRKLVLVNLCRLDIAYTGVKSQGVGDVTETAYENFLKERTMWLRRLRKQGLGFA